MPIRQGGFTIIELLVVGHCGVIAVIAIPSPRARSMISGSGAMPGRSTTWSGSPRCAPPRASRASACTSTSRLNSSTFSTSDKTASVLGDKRAADAVDGVDFDYGAMTAPPPNTQAALAQAPACKTAMASATSETPRASSSTRAASRSIRPAARTGTPPSMSPTTTGVYGVTVSATPLVRLWWSPASTRHGSTNDIGSRSVPIVAQSAGSA